MIIDNDLLDSVSELAKVSTRKRKNYNFHANLDDNVQKLLNAMEPGTEVPIHRHIETDEAYIVVRGGIKVILYDDSKNVILEEILKPQLGKFGIDIKAGQWHTLEVLETGTVIFEVKQGPYQPISDEHIMTL